MGKNTVDIVLKIAGDQVGYIEKSASAYKKNPDILAEKTAGAGSDNYTKYGRDMHKVYPQVMDFPAAWCDAFVDWCFYTSYGITNAKKLLGGNFDDYTVASAQLYKNKNALDTTPKIGDQVFFTKNGQVSGCYHTGLVYAVDKTHFYTIEGNTSVSKKDNDDVVANGGGVAKKQYSITTYKGKVLFGHPKYDKTNNSETPKKSIDEIAKEVINGVWGNGDTRTTKLKAAGYDPVEVQKKVNELLNVTKYYNKYTGKSNSIVDALKEMGIDASAKTRKKIAQANNISNYTGTAAQNNKLLLLLKSGKLVKI